MARSDSEKQRLNRRAREVLGDAALLRAVASTVTTPEGFAVLLEDVSDLPTRALLRLALAPLVSFPLEAPLPAAPGPVVPAASEGVSAMGNQSLRSLDASDHLTKRGGGHATHSGGTVGTPQREKSMKTGGPEPLKGAGGSNYGSGAKGAHGAKQVAAHGLNKPAAGKKLHK